MKIKPVLAVWLSIAAISDVTLVTATGNGQCSVQLSQYATVIQSQQVSSSTLYTTLCWDLWEFFSCEKYKTTYSTQYSIGSQLIYYTSYECCSGYQQVTSSPLICQPICQPECLQGSCISPYTCACDPGWIGDTCNNAVCGSGCLHGDCVGPGNCDCETGWTGDSCNTDIDECAVFNGGCSHDCVNTDGSHSCSCPVGYNITLNGYTCHGFHIESVNITAISTAPTLVVGTIEKVTFICDVEVLCSGPCKQSNVTFKWIKDDSEVFTESIQQVNLAENSTIHQEKVVFNKEIAVSDAGSYQCQAELSGMSDAVNSSTAWNVSVAIPSPSVMGKSAIVAVGDVALLTCTVPGTPTGTTITIQWKRAADMSGIPGANSTMFEVSSSANTSDTGVYTCEVTVSDEGKNSLVVPITVSVNITLTVTTLCEPGTYSESGLEPCEKCPPHHYQLNSGSTICQPCNDDTIAIDYCIPSSATETKNSEDGFPVVTIVSITGSLAFLAAILLITVLMIVTYKKFGRRTRATKQENPYHLPDNKNPKTATDLLKSEIMFAKGFPGEPESTDMDPVYSVIDEVHMSESEATTSLSRSSAQPYSLPIKKEDVDQRSNQYQSLINPAYSSTSAEPEIKKPLRHFESCTSGVDEEGYMEMKAAVH